VFLSSIIGPPKKGNRRIIFYDANGERQHFRLGKLSERAAKLVKGHVEEIVRCQLSRDTPKRSTSDWLGELGDTMREKLERVGLVEAIEQEAEAAPTLLGLFLDGYIAERDDVKESTNSVYKQTRRNLLGYFKATKPIKSITSADADDWRRWLARHEKLGENTIRRRCGVARQFFRQALKEGD
jgi:hypothetical protein